MILNLNALKEDFDNLKNIRKDIKQYFENLSNKIELLTGIYSKYISYQESNGNILFGLDALHFQTFLINFEYDNMNKMHILIENKLYCEYYKLFKLMCNYVNINIDDPSILRICEYKKKYPIYKDLEQYKIYDFELIHNIHDDILLLLEAMSKFVTKKEKELEFDETNTVNGLNLHLVVNTMDFNITLLKQNIKLYNNYLKIFHKYHTTYLSRLNIKIGIMWGQINKDIKLERSISPNNAERKETLKNCPSLTNVQQEELLSFIETNNSSVKDELNEIIINISDESDNDDSNVSDIYSDEKICQNENETVNANEIETTNEIVTMNDIKTDINNDIYSNVENNINMEIISNPLTDEIIMKEDEDVGSLPIDVLSERWNTSVNLFKLSIEEDDDNVCCESDEDDENIDEPKNEQDELNKWREIINNKHLTQEEKIKEKARLKKMRYKRNKRNSGAL
jgi:hypothetical protein